MHGAGGVFEGGVWVRCCVVEEVGDARAHVTGGGGTDRGGDEADGREHGGVNGAGVVEKCA